MRQKRQHEAMPDELLLAVGLVWGYLGARQYEEAYELASGCLQVWPHDPHLFLMASYAAAEVLEPVDRDRLLALRTPDNAAWIALVLRRLEIRTAPNGPPVGAPVAAAVASPIAAGAPATPAIPR